jgi:hypothetical protein
MSRSTGERGPFARLALLVGAAAVLLGASAAIVYPLWYLASYKRLLFDRLSLSFLGIMAAAAIARKVLSRRRKPKGGVP